MQISAGRPITINATAIMRKLGYKPWRDPKTGKESFIRRLGQAFYPRFHVYVLYEEDRTPVIDLHMDWRRPMHKKGQKSYEDAESDTVQEEARRIIQILDSIQ
ncbi:MAG: hypothetical protein KC925_01235 [Candidatus Doudnabacteria bacterium]|nr:hypothetical protein [Candidatus Doudnabacteria bacterium]